MKPFASDAYFLGPKSENAAWVRAEFQAILDHWFDWRRSLFMDDPSPLSPERRMSVEFLKEREHLAQQLRTLREMLCSEIPKYTPRYNGHMVSELSLPALFGHFATLLHNPNNTSKEAARIGAQMEVEAIAMLAGMVGFDPDQAQGHFTGGGTIANFEAVWRARYRIDHFLALALHKAENGGDRFDAFEAAHIGWDRYHRECEGIDTQALRACSGVLGNPFDYAERMTAATGRPWRGPVLLTPGNKHFSWKKATNVFGLGEEAFWTSPLDAQGRLDPDGLQAQIDCARDAGRPVLAVVSVAGTTEAGEIDSVDRVHSLLEAQRRRGIDIWHHVDAAYGGFFCTMLGGDSEATLSPGSAAALNAIRTADSVTLDPHKLGYVPYACGAFLTRDTQAYVSSSFQALYIDRAISNDKWACTLEGSRSAAGAAATWLTGKTMGFGPERFGRMLAGTIEIRANIQSVLEAEIEGVNCIPADTNILCFNLARAGEALRAANARTKAAFSKFQQDANFSISQTILTDESYPALIAAHVDGYGGVKDSDQLVLLRCVFMNPFWSNDAVREALIPEFVASVRNHLN
jgi:glutamate/tyrosine decarboxylase-like PLP-dependent enzyme